MLTKILICLSGISLLLLVLSGVALKFEHSRVTKAKNETIALQQKYNSLNDQYKLYQTLQGINFAVGNKYEQEATKDQSAKQAILSKVDTTTKQVNSHEITSAAADVSYTHSMWDAYCQASHETSTDCPAK